MASLDDVVTQLQGIVSNLSGLTQSDGGIPHGVTGQVLVAQTGTSPYFTSSPTISANLTVGGNITAAGNLVIGTALFSTGATFPVSIKNDGGYNLVSLNGATAFPNAIGIEGAATSDSSLYLYSQNRHIFYSGSTPVTEFLEDSGYGLLTFNNTGFPSAIGISGQLSGDSTLYLYSQSVTQFYNGNTNVADIGTTGVGTFIKAKTPPSGGTSALVLGNVAGFGIYVGTSAPTVSAGTGSLYLRRDGSTTNNRMYVNTDGSTTWTPVTTAA